jgi:hypothetical protein
MAESKPDFLQIDRDADFHERLSKLESGHTTLSRRISAIEDMGRGSGSSPEQMFDNKTLAMLIAIMIIPVALQVAGELVKRWQQQS